VLLLQFGVYAQVTDAALFSNTTEPDHYEELKNNFDSIFNNTIRLVTASAADSNNYKTFIENAYTIKEEVSGKYDVDVNIPLFNIESEILAGENERIKETYVTKLVSIVQKSERHTIYNVNYVAYLNDDVLSLVIRCKLKDKPDSPQRIMIETINYDLKNDKLLTLEDVISIKGFKREDVQDKIKKEIKTVSEQMEAISSPEYQVYQRDPKNSMYKIENTTEFFLGEEGILYIIYPYGNRDFTSQRDIILY